MMYLVNTKGNPGAVVQIAGASSVIVVAEHGGL
jgi:hypothetical protein